MNIKDDFILKNINEGYLVGGAVRDFLLGKYTLSDRDIAIKNAEAYSHKIAEKYNGTHIVLDSENKIYRVVLKDKINYIDISEFRANSIENDLRKRDFTINAIAFDLKNNKFIDVVGGIEDIKNKKIKQVSKENLEDDPLRILRAFRFKATTGFDITEDTKTSIKDLKNLCTTPANERIKEELIKLFGGDFASETLLEMENLQILEKLFPFVEEFRKVPPNTHHHLDLLHHSIESVRQIDLLLAQANEEVISHINKTDFGGHARINHLKLSAFMHDIGKFSTWTIEESGRHRFIKHDIVGEKLAKVFLREMKFSNKQIEYITSMIRNHIYPSNVISSPELSDKVMMRYIRKMQDNVIDNILLAAADRLSAKGPDITEEIISTNINGLKKLKDFYLANKYKLQPLPKLLDGNEIIKIKNIEQGKVLGKIIKALHEAQLDGDVTTKEEALDFVVNLPY